MKSHSLINWRTVTHMLCALGVVGIAGVFNAQADQWDKRTILTVNQPIQVQDRLLQPGQYVFKLLDSNSNRHIVQIYNGDQSHIIDTVLAIPNYRLQPTGKSQFLFWETPPGNPKALRAWFYPGDNFGQEFTYPKHLVQLEASAARTSTTTMTSAPPPEPPAAATKLETQAETKNEANREETPVETAQAAPPPTTPAPAPAAQAPPPAPEPPPEKLPKTATPYPLIGLGGLLSLSLYGLLRLTRSA